MVGTELLGFAAGTMTTFCWLPQAIKILYRRDARSISLPTQLVFTSGCVLWSVYGLAERRPSIWVFNIITAVLSASIVALKIHFDRSYHA